MSMSSLPLDMMSFAVTLMLEFAQWMLNVEFRWVGGWRSSPPPLSCTMLLLCPRPTGPGPSCATHSVLQSLADTDAHSPLALTLDPTSWGDPLGSLHLSTHTPPRIEAPSLERTQLTNAFMLVDGILVSPTSRRVARVIMGGDYASSLSNSHDFSSCTSCASLRFLSSL